MLSAGAGVSSARDARAAAREAAEAALKGAGRADAALVFATGGYGGGLKDALDEVAEVLGRPAFAGATAHGVIGAGREHEGEAALAVLALAGIEAHPFLIPDPGSGGAAAAEEIAAQLGNAPRDGDLVVLLPDPSAVHLDALLRGVRERLAPALVVGAGAADPLSARPLQWCGREIESGAVSGIALRGRRPARVGVTQACRPASELLTVTRARGNWILELDGRPALDVYREVARGPLAADLRRAAAFLFVALPRDPKDPLRPGGYLVRNVIGFSPEERAFAVPERVAQGQPLALALRDPERAREDLKAMLEALAGGAPRAALYFDCCARGASFFGVSGLEAAYLERAFPECPVAGMFGSCEIGPIGGETELLTYTGVLTLLDE